MMALDLFGVGSVADAIKSAEWIGAIFAGLAWAFGHPSTAAWVVGAGLIFAVLRKGWPFANVPEITTFLGKAIASTGLVLLLGGFGWRAADEILSPKSQSAKPSVRTESGRHIPPVTIPPVQRDLPGARGLEGG